MTRVTDHALIRYLERVKGFDIEAVRLHIAQVCANGMACGAGSVKAEGARFQLEHGKVVTVTPDNGGMPNRIRRERMIAGAAR